jgi:tRNA-dihydrouridine synthase
MMRQTGCDGVIVGRGCLGRPWLFRDLFDVFAGRHPENPPRLGAVVNVMLRHAVALARWLGEPAGVRSFRKHATWYTKGFRGSADLRAKLMTIADLAELREVLAGVDANEPFPLASMRVPRGKTSGTQTVSLPDGYLLGIDDDVAPEPAAEAAVSGG